MAQQTYSIQGRPVSQQQFQSYWNGIFKADPVLQSIYATAKANPFTGLNDPRRQAFEAAVDKRLAELGFGNNDGPNGTSDHDMRAHWKNGQLVVDRGSYLDRNRDWIAAAGVGAAILGPFAAAWLAAPAGSGGGASGGSSAAAAGGYSAPPPVIGGTAGTQGAQPVGAIAGGGGSVSGPTTGGVLAKAGDWAKRLFDDDFVRAGIGAGIGYMERRAARKATNKAIDEALADQRRATKEAQDRLDRQERLRGDIYNRQRTDFQNLANKPFQTLGGYLGIDIPDIGPVQFPNALPSNGQPISAPPGSTGGAMPPGTINPGGSLGAPRPPSNTPLPPGAPIPPKSVTLGDFGMPNDWPNGSIGRVVKMQAPDGTIEDVDPDDVELYESHGARRIS